MTPVQPATPMSMSAAGESTIRGLDTSRHITPTPAARSQQTEDPLLSVRKLCAEKQNAEKALWEKNEGLIKDIEGSAAKVSRKEKEIEQYRILIHEAKQEAVAHRAAMTEKIEERQEVKKRLAEVSDIQRKAAEMVPGSS